VTERRQLRRRVDRRLAAGVAGGVADWLNVSASFVRIVAVLASAFTEWITLAYAVAALLLPAEGRRRPDWDNLVGLGRLALIFLGPELLFGGGISVDSLLEQSPELWVPVGGLLLVGAAVLLASDYEHGPSPEQARARVLASLPVALFAAAVGLGVWLVPDVRWDQIAPAGAIVAGLALLVGVARGRWRALVAPSVVALCAVAALVAADVRLEGGIGDRTVRATAAGGLPPDQQVAIGNVGADLSRFRRGPRQETFRVSVGVGDVVVIVPRGAHVSVDARVGRGRLNTADLESGFDLRLEDPDARLYPVTRPARSPHPQLRLVADIGFGSLEIRRVDASGGL
jgi:phage shock protein PspC (stress-responsive transcriptional regulator)